MADERIFSIKINGVEESYKNTKRLVDMLNLITDVTAKVNVETNKNTVTNQNSAKASKEKAKALSDEEKAQKRIDDLQIKIAYSTSKRAKEEALLREELRRNNLVVRQNIRVNESEEGSIEQKRAELAKLRNEYVRLSRVQRDSEDGVKMLVNIERLTKETRELNKTIGVTSDRVGSYEDAIKNALGINNDFAKSIMDIHKESDGGLKSFFSNAGASVKAFGKTLLGLLSNPVFLAIAGIAGIGAGFKFWYDYNKGLEEATKLTKQFTDLTGNELKSFRNEVEGVSDTFGKDFKETLEATNAVAKQFGISQQEALQYIKDGFIAGADANGDFLNLLKEYPAYFKEAGISADQFISIIAETQNQGIFSDKGIDAIKEANIRLREMSTSTAAALDGIGVSSVQVQKDLQDGTKTTFEIMQQVSAKLNEYPEQSKQVGTAIADIFGGAGEDAGLQYLKTLKDIDTNLDEVKEKAGELGEIQERQMNANINLQNTVSALFDQTGGTFETMIGNAKVFATESLTSIVKGLIDIVNYFIRLYNESENFRLSVNGLVGAAQIVYETFRSILNYLIDNFKTLGQIVEGVFTLDFGKIKDAYVKWGKDTIDLFNDAGTAAMDGFNQAVENGKKQIKPIEIPVNIGGPNVITDAQKALDQLINSVVNKNKKFTISSSDSGKKDSTAQKEEAKILEVLLAERIKSLESAEQREIETIRNNARKRLAEIKGNSTEEAELRKLIQENAEKEIQDIRNKYSEQIAKDSEESHKKELSDQKQLLDIQLGYIQNFYDKIEKVHEVRDTAGFIDAEATRENVEEVNNQLNRYIAMLNNAKPAIIAYYDDLIATYKKDSIEYKKAQKEKEDALNDIDKKTKDAAGETRENADKLGKWLADHTSKKAKEFYDIFNVVIGEIMNAVNSIFDAVNAVFDAQLDDANEKYDAISEKYDEVVSKREESANRIEELEEQAANARGGRLAILQMQIQNEMAANQQLADQESKLAKEKEKAEKEKEKAERNQKKAQITSDIVTAISNTALGVSRALIWGFPLGTIYAAIVGAAGAVQIATMSKQLAKLEDGGLLKGKRHSQGGMRIEGTNIEVEGGEYVINRESTEKNTGLLKYINSQKRKLGPDDLSSMFSGLPKNFEPPFKKMFETGGQLPASVSGSGIDYSMMASIMKDSVKEVKIEPVVSVTDINNAQDASVKVDNWTGA